MHMEEYGYPQDEPSPVECDCDAAIIIVDGDEPMSALRYLDVEARFAQEARQRGIIKAVKVNGEDNAADLLTKATKELTHEKVARFKAKLMGGAVEQGPDGSA